MGLRVDLVSLVRIEVPTSFESLGCLAILNIMGLRELVRSIDGSPDKYKVLVTSA